MDQLWREAATNRAHLSHAPALFYSLAVFVLLHPFDYHGIVQTVRGNEAQSAGTGERGDIRGVECNHELNGAQTKTICNPCTRLFPRAGFPLFTVAVAPLYRLLAITFLLSAVTPLRAAELSDTLSTLPRSAPGTELGTIKVGTRTYHDVRIKSYDSRSLIFTHSEGLGSARLRDLTPDLQDLLGYNPSQAEPSAPPAIASAKPAQVPAQTLTALPQPLETTDAPDASAPTAFDALVTAFGTKPDLRVSQNLQSEFFRLSFTAKSQGRRMSCAIFAVVGALEFQNAKATGTPQKLSEDYLIWATRRIAGQAPARSTGQAKPPVSQNAVPRRESQPEDLGYSLSDVISGLRAYGIATQSELPDQYPAKDSAEIAPDDVVIASARTRRLVNILPVPGRQNQTVLANIVHALNCGYPVPIGLRWPYENSIRTGFLRDQAPRPNAFHAVTLVGYECPNKKIEDTVFIFKNSFGAAWGVDGYGRATWSYLEQNLTDAIVLDVGPGTKGKPGTKP